MVLGLGLLAKALQSKEVQDQLGEQRLKAQKLQDEARRLGRWLGLTLDNQFEGIGMVNT